MATIIHHELTLELPFEEVDIGGSIESGFRQNHMSGGNDALAVELDSGAGCGNPWISVSITPRDADGDELQGKGRYFRLHGERLIEAVVAWAEANDKEPS